MDGALPIVTSVAGLRSTIPCLVAHASKDRTMVNLSLLTVFSAELVDSGPQAGVPEIVISRSGRVDPICTEPGIKMLQAHPVSSQSLDIPLALRQQGQVALKDQMHD